MYICGIMCTKGIHSQVLIVTLNQHFIDTLVDTPPSFSVDSQLTVDQLSRDAYELVDTQPTLIKCRLRVN